MTRAGSLFEEGASLNYKALLFDLDDTLLDSMAARVNTLRHVSTSAVITHPV